MKQVNIDSEPNRYCSNAGDHGHFHDLELGKVNDIKWNSNTDIKKFLELPEEAAIENIELNIKGSLK